MGRWLVGVLLLVGCATAPRVKGEHASAPTYAIHMHRATPVGTTWSGSTHFELRNQRRTHRASDGVVVSDEVQARTIDMIADYEVTGGGSDGLVLRVAVDALEWDVGQGPSGPATIPFVVVQDRREGGGVFDEAGQPIDSALEAILRDVLPPPHVSADDDDDAFGTSEAVPVGASWPVNAVAIARGFATSAGMAIDAGNVHGETSLVDVRSSPIGDLLLVSTSVDAHGGLRDLRPGATIRAVELTLSAEGSFPVDVTRLVVDEHLEMTSRVELAISAPGGELLTEISARRVIHRTRSQ